MKEFEVLCKPFSSFPPGRYRVKVDDDPTRAIWVYDNHVGGVFTTIHVLSLRAQSRIRRLASCIKATKEIKT